MIIIINPPNPEGTVSNKDMMAGLGQLYPAGGPKIPPIDIAYIAACLKSERLPFEVIDCLGLVYSFTELLLKIKNLQNSHKDITLAIRTSLPTSTFDLNIAKLLKENTDAKIIMFGPYVSLNREFFLEKTYIDAVIVNEPEYIFVDIYKKGLKNTDGLWYRTAGGDVVKNKEKDYIDNLDVLPFPAWQYLPYKNYILPSLQFPSVDYFLPVISSRGCPFFCHYCPYPVLQGRRWRPRSATNVVEEIKYLMDRFKVKNILFRDPEFTLNRERIVLLCKLICEEKIKFNWRCETRLDTLDSELITLMAKAGCCGMNFGIETPTPEVAQKSGRTVSEKEKMLDIFKACKKSGIRVFCFFIIGLPGQDKKEIFQMINLAHEIDPDEVQFSLATPYPGTKLRQWVEEKDFILDKDPRHYTGYFAVTRNEFLSRRQLAQIYSFAQHSLGRRKSTRGLRIKNGGLLQYGKEIAKDIFFSFEKMLIGR